PGIDYPGIAALSAGLVALLFALDQASAWGWTDGRILLSLALALLFLLLFVARERRAGPGALVPGDVLRNRGVALACALKVLMAPAYAALLLYLPQIMQKLLGFSPLHAGLGMLPMLGGYAIVSLLSGLLAGRLSDRLAILAGIACLAIGPFLLSGFVVDAGYTGLAAGMLVTGIGLGLFQPAIQTEAVRADAQGRKSLVGGLVLMFQFVGGAVGLGLTTTIVASTQRAAVSDLLLSEGVTLPDAQREALEKLLSGAESARQVLRQFDPAVAQRLLDVAGDAFADGVRAGLRLDAAIVAAGVVVALLMLGRARKAAPRHTKSG
ncbi:MAG: MFS transporter, partial [Chloroflexi bacterium]|nr:MFS transporter [Chloroflexota bacterium]